MNKENCKFQKAIQVPRHVSQSVMDLPCVESFHKSGNGGYYYVLYWIHMHDNTRCKYAHPGEWLCEDYDGKWHVLTDDEYKKLQARED